MIRANAPFSAVVLEASIGHQQTFFKTLARIDCEDDGQIYATRILGGRVLIGRLGFTGLFLLWDYQASRVCQWCAFGGQETQKGCMLTDEYVLSVVANRVYVWDFSQHGSIQRRRFGSIPETPCMGLVRYELTITREPSAGVSRSPQKDTCAEIIPPPAFRRSRPLYATVYRPNRMDKGLCSWVVLLTLQGTVTASFLHQISAVVAGKPRSPPSGDLLPAFRSPNSVPEATFRMYACHPREMASHDASPDVVREVAAATPIMQTYLALNSRPIASCGFSGRVVYIENGKKQKRTVGERAVARLDDTTRSIAFVLEKPGRDLELTSQARLSNLKAKDTYYTRGSTKRGATLPPRHSGVREDACILEASMHTTFSNKAVFAGLKFTSRYSIYIVDIKLATNLPRWGLRDAGARMGMRVRLEALSTRSRWRPRRSGRGGGGGVSMGGASQPTALKEKGKEDPDTLPRVQYHSITPFERGQYRRQALSGGMTHEGWRCEDAVDVGYTRGYSGPGVEVRYRVHRGWMWGREPARLGEMNEASSEFKSV
ncbi:hypothetical protein FA13DRAFT_1716241 [Coprinellus micaceus]|uniref:Uncharacterized protein n=1 Tax=Coprinellus micaceus TaxID=71717 RepID=A0A4Y7SK12_COPMI|nr:hypothetical protein FA13DRAFT_1716241 [Coprinellus micaceus]